ncbi:hypothetical protein AB0N05_37540 [Nocardia sp. NPDC051030]|uniref:hypothetical protein n=1 Tax=Nocardia sp. NPDC051030 TaxID=3155162 RepID=UPI0034186180
MTGHHHDWDCREIIDGFVRYECRDPSCGEKLYEPEDLTTVMSEIRESMIAELVRLIRPGSDCRDYLTQANVREECSKLAHALLKRFVVIPRVAVGYEVACRSLLCSGTEVVEPGAISVVVDKVRTMRAANTPTAEVIARLVSPWWVVQLPTDTT